MAKDTSYTGPSSPGDQAPEYVEGAKIREEYSKAERRFPRSRERIRFCRDLVRGRIGVVLPKKGDYSNEELARTVIVRHPIKKTLPIRMKAAMSKDKAILVRSARSGSLGGMKQATDIETFVNSAVDQLIDNTRLMGIGNQDAEYAVLCYPSPVDLLKTPDYMESVLDEQGNPLVDDDGNPVRTPKETYNRDKRGRRPGDKGYKERDEEASGAAYEQERKDYLARRLPFVCRVEHATNCYPVLSRGRGKEQFETIGLVVRTLYERDELIRRKYKWDQMDDKALIPEGYDPKNPSDYGANGQVYLYEYFGLNEDGDPYYSVCVGGKDTYRQGPDGEDYPPTINLREEYGLGSLPVKYLWANTLDDPNPDEIGVPLFEPVAEAILNVETAYTHELIYGRRVAFPGYGIEINPDIPTTAFLDAKGRLKDFEVPSEGGIVPLPGRIVPMVPPRVGDSVRYVTEELMREIQAGTPTAPGETPGSSGHQDVIQASYFQMSQQMVREAAAEARRFVGQIVLELCYTAATGKWEALGGKGINIVVYADVEIPPGGDKPNDVASEKKLLEFKERWCDGENFDLRAEYPAVGDIATIQQIANLEQMGLAHIEDVLEARGKTAPEVEIAKIAAYKMLLGSPEGQLSIQQFAARIRGDKEKADQLELRIQQRLFPGSAQQPPMPAAQATPPGAEPVTAPPPGQATGEAPPGPPEGNVQPGGMGVNLAGSALGGIVSAATNGRGNDAMGAGAVLGPGIPRPPGL